MVSRADGGTRIVMYHTNIRDYAEHVDHVLGVTTMDPSGGKRWQEIEQALSLLHAQHIGIMDGIAKLALLGEQRLDQLEQEGRDRLDQIEANAFERFNGIDNSLLGVIEALQMIAAKLDDRS